ncbi:hypothetical protein DTL70_31295 [Streptomyces diacarni]|uniref:Uncharacterized protein n=1 Tax=Streptomyces diacarni TaxID=2800381 RepID=A0A367E8L4_9ACTN|nr:hypothetical protein DTL70_31295 [Streptomyces diacarni]
MSVARAPHWQRRGLPTRPGPGRGDAGAVTGHQSPVTSHQSPVTSHQSPVTSGASTPVRAAT